MIGDLINTMATAQKLSIEQVMKGVQSGSIPAYVGVPLIQQKMKDRQRAAAVLSGQDAQQPPVADQVMQAADQLVRPEYPANPTAPGGDVQQPAPSHGIDSARSNLPQGFAGGGIVAFAEGGEADTGYGFIPVEGYAFLDAIADKEAPSADLFSSYDTQYGGGHFGSNFQDHPRTPITRGGVTSRAAGRYQFMPDTWDEQAKKLGLTDFSPASQDLAAWDLAQTRYAAKTGRNLLDDLQSNNPDMLPKIGRALSGTWPSMPGGSQQLHSDDSFSNAYGMALMGAVRPLTQILPNPASPPPGVAPSVTPPPPVSAAKSRILQGLSSAAQSGTSAGKAARLTQLMANAARQSPGWQPPPPPTSPPLRPSVSPFPGTAAGIRGLAGAAAFRGLPMLAASYELGQSPAMQRANREMAEAFERRYPKGNPPQDSWWAAAGRNELGEHLWGKSVAGAKAAKDYLMSRSALLRDFAGGAQEPAPAEGGTPETVPTDGSGISQLVQKPQYPYSPTTAMTPTGETQYPMSPVESPAQAAGAGGNGIAQLGQTPQYPMSPVESPAQAAEADPYAWLAQPPAQGGEAEAPAGIDMDAAIAESRASRQELRDMILGEGKKDAQHKQDALNMALMHGGFKMMQGTSPWALSNIGAGGEAFAETYGKGIQDLEAAKQERVKQVVALGLKGAELDATLQQLGITQKYYNDHAGLYRAQADYYRMRPYLEAQEAQDKVRAAGIAAMSRGQPKYGLSDADKTAIETAGARLSQEPLTIPGIRSFLTPMEAHVLQEGDPGSSEYASIMQSKVRPYLNRHLAAIGNARARAGAKRYDFGLSPEDAGLLYSTPDDLGE